MIQFESRFQQQSSRWLADILEQNQRFSFLVTSMQSTRVRVWNAANDGREGKAEMKSIIWFFHFEAWDSRDSKLQRMKESTSDFETMLLPTSRRKAKQSWSGNNFLNSSTSFPRYLRESIESWKIHRTWVKFKVNFTCHSKIIATKSCSRLWNNVHLVWINFSLFHEKIVASLL